MEHMVSNRVRSSFNATIRVDLLVTFFIIGENKVGNNIKIPSIQNLSVVFSSEGDSDTVS